MRVQEDLRSMVIESENRRVLRPEETRLIVSFGTDARHEPADTNNRIRGMKEADLYESDRMCVSLPHPLTACPPNFFRYGMGGK